jgi:hypothetical protein
MAGLLFLAVVAWFATSRHWSALAIGAATTGVLLVVATWEAFALRARSGPDSSRNVLSRSGRP